MGLFSGPALTVKIVSVFHHPVYHYYYDSLAR